MVFGIILVWQGSGQALTVTTTAGTLSGSHATLKAAFVTINEGTHRGTITVVINCSTAGTASAMLNATSSPSKMDPVINHPGTTAYRIRFDALNPKSFSP